MLNLYDLSFSELEHVLAAEKQPKYRCLQIWQWLWQKGCRDFSQMTNISKELRNSLASRFNLELPQIDTLRQSQDGTTKFLLRLADNSLVESVLIPSADHYTLCISTQVGCSMACSFCSTGQMGLTRNLSSGEILSQVLLAREHLVTCKSQLGLRNLVLMGMGEPLLNWEQVHKSLQVLNDPQAIGLSHRRITLSTVGIPGKIEEVGNSGLASLALSLHSPNQELRSKLMPRAARFQLQDLLRSLQNYPLRPRQRITIEYILLGGVNDSLKQAKELVSLLSSLRCKVNLIAFNPGEGINYQAPEQKQILAFEEYLWQKGFTVTLRKSKGQDIGAACGQLKSQIKN